MKPAISIRNLSKCYKLGVISRQTLVDEVRYWWSKVRGRDPREHFTKIGHSAADARRVEAENTGDDRFWALKDVSFDVQPGEVVGIIGRNGAGKSTLLKILTRITEPTSGEAIINGRIGSLLEVGTGFHPELTGRENIYMNGTILGMKKDEITSKFNEIVSFSELEQFIDTPVKRYSSGMYVRLAFAVAAHLDPEILLIDEVLAVGDMGFQKKCLGKMGNIASEGRTILFVSHNMSAINRLCSRAILLNNGLIEYDGNSNEATISYTKNGLNNGEGQQLPGDALGSKSVKLIYICLRDKMGKKVSGIDVKQRANVEFCYRILEPKVYFRLFVMFYAEGVLVFSTISQEEIMHERVGDYFAAVELPENIMAETTYSIGILMASFKGGEKKVYLRLNDIFFFQVYDAMDGPSARGDFTRKYLGLLRPSLKWKVKGPTGEVLFEQKNFLNCGTKRSDQ